MGRRARIGLVSTSLLAGCAQIAGIDNTTAGDPPAVATLGIDRVSIGANVVTTPLDLTMMSATYLIENPNAPDGLDRITAEPSADAEGTWTATVGESSPIVLFTVPEFPEPQFRMLMAPLYDVRVQHALYEHPNAVAAPDPSTLTVQATLPTPFAATESFQFLAVGPWATRGFAAAGEVPAVGDPAFGPVSFAYTTMDRITNRPYEQITTADATVLLRYVGTRLTGVMEGTPFDQTATDTVMATMSAVAATETLTATLNNTTVAARFSPLRPSMPAPAMSWNIIAAPGYASAATQGPRLNGAAVTDADASALSVPYGNPFVAKGWQTLVNWNVRSTRSVTLAGSLPVTLSAGLQQIVQPTADLVLDSPAGIPELISLDGQPLSTDGYTIDKPIKALEATFVVPPSPVNDVYQLQLYELAPNAGGTALIYVHKVSILNTEPRFVIPPEFFERDKKYTLRAQAQAGGYPNRADGDFATRQLPFAYGYMDSGIVVVRP